MSGKRKSLLALALALLGANLAFLYYKTRPVEADLLFHNNDNFDAIYLEPGALVDWGIHLNDDNTWQKMDGTSVDPLAMLEKTSPETPLRDSLIWLSSDHEMTFGYMISAISALAGLGICNVVVGEIDTGKKWAVLKTERYRDFQSGQLRECRQSLTLAPHVDM